MKNQINIAGIVPFTTIDYPDSLAAVLFCQGCSWRCHYCHNPHLQKIATNKVHFWDEIYQFLLTRKGFLDAVVLSGGDPLLQPNLKDVVLQIKDLGFKVGLHTAGMNSLKLQSILPYIDWIGMDIKAPFQSYKSITNIEKSGKQAKFSAELIIKSGIKYEFRTTVHPKLLSTKDLFAIAKTLINIKANTFVLQKFRPNGCMTESLNNNHIFSWDPTLIIFLKQSFTHFTIRE